MTAFAIFTCIIIGSALIIASVSDDKGDYTHPKVFIAQLISGIALFITALHIMGILP